jgi:hypothetical protein
MAPQAMKNATCNRMYVPLAGGCGEALEQKEMASGEVKQIVFSMYDRPEPAL